MNGFRFYAEMPADRASKRATKAFPAPFTRDGIRRAVKAGNAFNVTAVFTDPEHRMQNGMVECIGAVFDRDNSPVTLTACSWDWLSSRCVRIDEETARKSHPELFKRLDD